MNWRKGCSMLCKDCTGGTDFINQAAVNEYLLNFSQY